MNWFPSMQRVDYFDSAIPLVQYYRAAKGNIRQHEADKLKSDKARERFEQRKARIAKEEAAKEAKRLARKKAAEEAKQKLSEKTSENESKASPGEDKLAENLIVQAQNAARLKAEDPAAEQKKLARAKLSVDNRIERIETQLADTEDVAKRDKLVSQLQQAKLKQQELEKKLSNQVVP